MATITVIVTVWNEASAIDALLDSLLGGTRVPDEIVISDGGSGDGTWERLRERSAREPRLRAIQVTGNRSVGRNAAVRAAKHDLIACTDAGVEVDSRWLERLVAPFEADPSIDVVAGFYEPAGRTAFERAAGVVSAPGLREIDLNRFLPSTRSIGFRRAAFDRAGGFDEALAHNEDTPFALALKRAGSRFAFAPDAIVRWRPRGTLGAFMHQHRRFGTGDGEARVQGWFYRKIASKYAMAIVLLLAGFAWPPFWGLLGAAGALFWVQQARRGQGRIPAAEALLLVPPLKVAYDLAYLTGYLKGRLAPTPSGPPPPPLRLPRDGD